MAATVCPACCCLYKQPLAFIDSHVVAVQGDMGDQPGLTLPFEPLSFIFQHVYYSVAASSVSQGSCCREQGVCLWLSLWGSWIN